MKATCLLWYLQCLGLLVVVLAVRGGGLGCRVVLVTTRPLCLQVNAARAVMPAGPPSPLHSVPVCSTLACLWLCLAATEGGWAQSSCASVWADVCWHVWEGKFRKESLWADSIYLCYYLLSTCKISFGPSVTSGYCNGGPAWWLLLASRLGSDTLGT